MLAALLGAAAGCGHPADSSEAPTTAKADDKSPMPGDEPHLQTVKACDAMGLDRYACLAQADDALIGMIDALVNKATLPADQQPASAADAFKSYRAAMGLLDPKVEEFSSLCDMITGDDALAHAVCVVAAEDNLAGFIDRYVNFGLALDGAPQNPLPVATMMTFRMRHPACYQKFDPDKPDPTLDISRVYQALASCVAADTAARQLPAVANADLLKGAVRAAIDATNKLCQTLVDAGPTVGTSEATIDRATCLEEGANLIDLLFN
jgi:hypothetical protein